MFFLTLTGCSLSYGRKNSLTVKNNNFNLEIIQNYSKAISRDPNNFNFYLERGKAKHEYGDYKGAIKDFNNSFKIKQDLKVNFYKANSKYKYGKYKGAIKHYENLNVLEEYEDEIFYNLASAQLLNFDYRSP